MKFENPIMNISMFEVENVVTTISGQGPTSAAEAVEEFISQQTGTTGGITITF